MFDMIQIYLRFIPVGWQPLKNKNNNNHNEINYKNNHNENYYNKKYDKTFSSLSPLQLLTTKTMIIMSAQISLTIIKSANLSSFVYPDKNSHNTKKVLKEALKLILTNLGKL